MLYCQTKEVISNKSLFRVSCFEEMALSPECISLHADFFYAVVVVTQILLNEREKKLFKIAPQYLFASPDIR